MNHERLVGRLNDEDLERELTWALLMDAPGRISDELRAAVAAVPDEQSVVRAGGGRRSRILRAALVVAAAVAVIAASVGFGWTLRGGILGPAATATPTVQPTIPSATATATAKATIPSATAKWSDPVTIQQSIVEDAAGNGARVVAVGWVNAPPDGIPSAWTSTDGRNWTQATFPDETGRMEAVVESTTGWLAVGFVSTSATGGEPTQSAAAWTSADGLTWVRAPSSSQLDLGTGFRTDWPLVGMSDVIWTDAGFVAVGADLHSAAAWTSPDGLHWTRQTVEDAANRSLTAVREFRGGLIAVGANEGVEGGATVVTSKDGGRNWRRAAIPAGSGPLRLLETDGTTLVAGGSVALDMTPGQLSGLWRSTDGISWTAATGPVGCPSGMAIGSIAPLSAGGFMAVGASGCSDATSAAAIWRSPDGSTWTPDDPAITLSAPGLKLWCRGPGGVVIVFAEGDADGTQVWIGSE